MFERTRYAAHFAVAIALAALFSSGSRAKASGPECAEMFRPETSEYRVSENYRLGLISHAKKLVQLVRAARMQSTVIFQLQVERRDELTRNRLNQSIETSPTLSEIDMHRDVRTLEPIRPPRLGQAAKVLMQDERVSLDKVAEALRTDPYFEWLRHEGLWYQASQKDNLRLTHNFLTPPIDQANPRRLFIEYRKEGLSPDLALIRVMRNMDPVLSATAVDAASSALFHNSLEHVLLEKVLPNLSSRKSGAGRDPWLLMPTLREGRQNLKKLLDKQVTAYGGLFPRVVYERVLSYSDRHNPALFVMMEYRARRLEGDAEGQIVRELHGQLKRLRSTLGLTSEFPLDRLYDIVDKIVSLRSLSSDAYLRSLVEP